MNLKVFYPNFEVHFFIIPTVVIHVLLRGYWALILDLQAVSRHEIMFFIFIHCRAVNRIALFRILFHCITLQFSAMSSGSLRSNFNTIYGIEYDVFDPFRVWFCIFFVLSASFLSYRCLNVVMILYLCAITYLNN